MTERVVLAQVEELAKDATERCWSAVDNSVFRLGLDPRLVATVPPAHPEDAAFIAAADPPTVEAMARWCRDLYDALTEAQRHLAAVGQPDAAARAADVLDAARDAIDFAPAPTHIEEA